MAGAGARGPRVRIVRAGGDPRLNELRWAALEQRIDADLAAGGHAQLISELGALIAEHPLREHLRGQLMLALYRAGRQAEALAAYRQAQRELADELGLEPGEELKRLEQAILRQDPALDLAREAPVAGPAPSRSLLVVPGALDGVDALTRLAESLAAAEPPRELIIATIGPGADLGIATAALAERRGRLMAGGVATRTAAFSSQVPGRDIVRLAGQEGVDLLLMDLAHRNSTTTPAPSWSRRRATSPCSPPSAGLRGRGRSWSRSVAPGTTGRRSSSAPGSPGRPMRGCD